MPSGALATSARSCSAARNDFFERQPEAPQPLPKATYADVHGAFCEKPGLQFGERRVGFAQDTGEEGLVVRGELRLGTARPSPRARLFGRPPPKALYIGHADLKNGRGRIGASPRFNRRHDPLAQILRVSSAHCNSPPNQQGKRITDEAQRESQRDSSRRENALDFHYSDSFALEFFLKGSDHEIWQRSIYRRASVCARHSRAGALHCSPILLRSRQT